MLSKLTLLAGIAAAKTEAVHADSKQDHWAIIVAGSKGYGNYRHQADACHAYQIAIKNGIPAEQIISIMEDDVANSRSNPFPGKIFNKPSAAGTPGVDVYAGCNIDYKGKQATAETLLKVMKGDATAGGKVLKSDANSKIFWYFADHGAPGLVAMPNGKYLYADELHETVKYMHTNKMYKEMVMYMEACESGSMFEHILEDDINVYAVSAANAKESSWGTYCSPDDKVDGKDMHTCLGDLFSVNWMEDSDKGKMAQETMLMQYNTVKKLTAKSHVLQWGELSIAAEPIGNFQAGSITMPKDLWSNLKYFGKDLIKNQLHVEENLAVNQKKNDFAVDSRDIKLHYLYMDVLHNPSKESQEALMKELAHRLHIDGIFDKVFPQFMTDVKNGTYPTIEDYDCYRMIINQYTEACGEPDTYTMKYFKAFASQCQAQKYYPAANADMKAKLTTACGEQQ